MYELTIYNVHIAESVKKKNLLDSETHKQGFKKALSWIKLQTRSIYDIYMHHIYIFLAVAKDKYFVSI